MPTNWPLWWTMPIRASHRWCEDLILLDNTARQILLQQMLGVPSPDYMHLPLIVNADGNKLSKQTYAKALPLTGCTTLLLQTLHHLRQKPPARLQAEQPSTVLAWAVANWQRHRIGTGPYSVRRRLTAAASPYPPKLLPWVTSPDFCRLAMYIDRLVLLFIVGAYLLSPSIIEWWSDGGTAWYRPYLIWLGLIILSYWIGKSRDLTDL
jgi:hypothetical protein